MRNKCYICNATNLQSEAKHTEVSQFGVSSCVTNASRKGGFVAKLIRGIRSLFVHTKRKTCYTMLQTNKQARQAKNSNLSQKTITTLIVLGTLVIGTLLLIFAPDILLAFGKFLACLALTAMVVIPMLYSLTYKPYENN